MKSRLFPIFFFLTWTLPVCFVQGETTGPSSSTETVAEAEACPPEDPNSIGYQCVAGLLNGIVDLIRMPGQLAQVIALGQKRLAECDRNENVKRGLLVVLEPMVNMENWMSMTCEQIINSRLLHEQNYLREVVGKRTQMERFQNLLQQSDGDPTRQEFLRQRIAEQQLSPAETDFLNRYMARESLVDHFTGADLQQALDCTSLREIMVYGCEFVAGGGSGYLATRLARVGSRGLRRGLENIAPRLTPFQSMARSFQSAPNVEFYTAAGRVPTLEIRPGDTFTVIIKEGRLILGRDIPGVDGHLGGAESHRTLMRLMGEPTDYLYYGRAGAVRFNRNGSIDISGYHLEDNAHPRAFRDIQSIMEGIFPEGAFRATPDRLSTLPSL